MIQMIDKLSLLATIHITLHKIMRLTSIRQYTPFDLISLECPVLSNRENEQAKLFSRSTVFLQFHQIVRVELITTITKWLSAAII